MKKKKKLLAVLLVMAMTFSIVPMYSITDVWASENDEEIADGKVEVVDLQTSFDIYIAANINDALTPYSGDDVRLDAEYKPIQAAVFGSEMVKSDVMNAKNLNGDKIFVPDAMDYFVSDTSSTTISKTGVYELSVQARGDAVDLTKTGAVWMPILIDRTAGIIPKDCNIRGNSITVTNASESNAYRWDAKLVQSHLGDFRLYVCNLWANYDQYEEDNPISETIPIKKGDIITFKFYVTKKNKDDVSEEPDKTVMPMKTPDIAETPNTTKEPDATETPTATPDVAETPNTTKEPGATETPTATKVPDVTGIPNAIASPKVSPKIPSTTQSPQKVVTQEKISSERNVTLNKPKVKVLKNNKEKKTIINITKIRGAKYEITYGVKKNFKGAKKIRIGKTTYVFKNLRKGKKYYVRVRAYLVVDGERVYSAYSGIKTVKS